MMRDPLLCQYQTRLVVTPSLWCCTSKLLLDRKSVMSWNCWAEKKCGYIVHWKERENKKAPLEGPRSPSASKLS